MSTGGLQRMLDFLDKLDDAGVHYQIDQSRPDSLLVGFTLVGARVEVDFYVDRVTYRCFRGREDVHVDQTLLHGLIAEAAA